MAEIVNLRLARKRARRQASEAEADKNRALHSVPARQRKDAAAKNAAADRRHEAHRIEFRGGAPSVSGKDGGDTPR